MLCCPLNSEPFAFCGLAPLFGYWDAPFALQVLSCERVVHACGRAEVGDLAATFSCPRSQIEHEVALPDNFRIMFHHDNRVADVSKALQDTDETMIVPGVKADARLIKDIEAVDKGGT